MSPFFLKLARSFALLAAFVCLSACLCLPAPAQTKIALKGYEFQLLYNFTGVNDGGTPVASLIMDSGGNLYGTTIQGGANGNGTIFEYAPSTNTLMTLHTFSAFNTGTNTNSDGAVPFSSLIMDRSGNLYGTASEGGVNGYGTIFQYVRATNTFATLHSFTGYSNGDSPYYGGLLIDGSGNLYGTTSNRATHTSGTIFKYALSTNTFTTLYAFTPLSSNENSDGANPNAGLIMDNNGILYGTTYSGGMNGNGIVFQYAPTTNTLTTLHTFSSFFSSFNGGENGDGANPNAGLLLASSDNLYLYGETQYGGANGNGTVFKYSPATNTFTILHTFSAVGYYGNADGAGPFDSLIMDRSGNLYGTASGGGSGVEQVGNGTAFRYALAANKFTTLYTFSPFDNYPFNLTNSSGAQPAAGLIMDSNGNLYGTTWKGAAYGYGAIFVLHPVYYVIPPHSSQPTQGSSPPPPHGTAPTP